MCFLGGGSFCFLVSNDGMLFVVGSSGTNPLSPGPHRVVDKLFGNTRYFVIKSNNYENVDIAKTRVRACVCACVCVCVNFNSVVLISLC